MQMDFITEHIIIQKNNEGGVLVINKYFTLKNIMNAFQKQQEHLDQKLCLIYGKDINFQEFSKETIPDVNKLKQIIQKSNEQIIIIDPGDFLVQQIKIQQLYRLIIELKQLKFDGQKEMYFCFNSKLLTSDDFHYLLINSKKLVLNGFEVIKDGQNINLTSEVQTDIINTNCQLIDIFLQFNEQKIDSQRNISNMSAQSFQNLIKKEEQKIEPNFYCFDTDEQQYNILRSSAISTDDIRAIGQSSNRRQSRRNLRTTSMANLKFVDSESSQKTTKQQDSQKFDYIDNI